ncbi:hypothetical protein H0H93_007380, partial [Arthromyces matolae]
MGTTTNTPATRKPRGRANDAQVNAAAAAKRAGKKVSGTRNPRRGDRNNTRECGPLLAHGRPEICDPSGHLRNQDPNHGKWVDDRRRQVEFADDSPVVLIIGGGQIGLEVAARLKALEVSTLVIEKKARIGDNWRNRYGALCLHNPDTTTCLTFRTFIELQVPAAKTQADVCQMSRFPPTWPVYPPALANWLESYAESMELNVNLRIARGGSERTFTLKHVVLAMDWEVM